MNKMRMHEFMLLPDGNFHVPLDGDQTSLILDCLQRVHAALLTQITNDSHPESQRQKAFDYAHKTEVVYDHIMKTLKLYRPERGDLS